TRSGIDPEAAIALESNSERLSAHLTRLPLNVELHQLTRRDADAVLLAPNSPGAILWELILDILTAGGTAKRVATSKLVARKRPLLLPVRDNKVVGRLGGGTRWWES